MKLKKLGPVSSVCLLIVILSQISCEDQPNEGETLSSESSIDNLAGERISESSNLRDTINGNLLFTVDNNSKIETALLSEKWAMVVMKVALNKEERESRVILPGSEIKSLDGIRIGRSEDSVKVFSADSVSGMIYGWTLRKNISANSIPELALSEFIHSGGSDLDDFELFIRKHGFKRSDQFDDLNLKYYTISQSILENNPAQTRLGLIFNNENEMIAVVHSRKFNLPSKEAYSMGDGKEITLVRTTDPTLLSEIIEKGT